MKRKKLWMTFFLFSFFSFFFLHDKEIMIKKEKNKREKNAMKDVLCLKKVVDDKKILIKTQKKNNNCDKVQNGSKL